MPSFQNLKMQAMALEAEINRHVNEIKFMIPDAARAGEHACAQISGSLRHLEQAEDLERKARNKQKGK